MKSLTKLCMVVVAVSVCVLFRWTCFIQLEQPLLSSERNQTVRRLRHAMPKVSYIYIVGVEGVGHHGISPAIASISKACRQYVVYESSTLRTSQKKRLNTSYSLALKEYKHIVHPPTDVTIIEDSSFPSGRSIRSSSTARKKSEGMYDLEWVYDQIVRAKGVHVKFLYLNRDFYRTVASHPEFDGGFEAHAQVLHDFVWYLHSEYQRIDAKEGNLWRQISYEWFTRMDNCTTLVSALIDFLGFTECDVDLACTVLNNGLHAPSNRTTNQTNYEYARRFNTSLPIPLLNLSAAQTFSFRNITMAPEEYNFFLRKRPHVRSSAASSPVVLQYATLSSMREAAKRNMAEQKLRQKAAAGPTTTSSTSSTTTFSNTTSATATTTLSTTTTSNRNTCTNTTRRDCRVPSTTNPSLHHIQ